MGCASILLLAFLLKSSLLHTTSSSVYHVIPDDHYTADNNTYTLQHYLNNVNKYFTSHTQLHFLPGQYYLNTDLIIQHVSNLSLIGNRTNEVINSVIKCTSPAGIVVVGSSNIVIENIVMNECGSHFNNSVTVNQLFTKYYQSLLILDCHTVTCMYFHSKWSYIPSGIKFVNAYGNTTILHVVSSNLKVWYSDINSLMSNKTHTILIESYQTYGTIYYTYALDIQMFHSNVHVAVKMLNINFHNVYALRITPIESSGHSMIVIANCSFHNEEIHPVYDHPRDDDTLLCHNYHSYNRDRANFCELYPTGNFVSMIYCFYNNDNRHDKPNQIHFRGCNFKNVSQPSDGKLLYFFQLTFRAANITVKYAKVSIISCLFNNTKYVHTMAFESFSFNDRENRHLLVLIRNVTISHSDIHSYYNSLNVRSVNLYIENLILTSILITNDYIRTSIIGAIYSYVEFNNYNMFRNNTALSAISSSVVHLQENTELNFSMNKIFSIIISPGEEEFNIIPNGNHILMCAVQYVSKRGNLDTEFKLKQKLNYSIVLYKNIGTQEISTFLTRTLMHCSWSSATAFVNALPFHVNQNFIRSDTTTLEEGKRSVCLCTFNNTYNCHRGIVGPFYPGQTVLLSFTLDKNFVSAAQIEIRDDNSDFICQSNNLIQVQLESGECIAIHYKVQHNREWCELILTAQPLPVKTFASIHTWTERYTIVLQPCPKGFILHPQGYCQCDPILSSHIPSLTTCDIDHQTIPRPANSWISAHTINNSHSYHVSLHCPFDYCLPHSSKLNLSTPDSQCQFNRSDVLCGQCQHCLSTVFGSSQCKHCPSVYLLIIIPIGIAGVVLVLLLFVLNLTVANGNINPFLFYVNIISINISILFQRDKSGIHAIVALTNLDLGIETCFYNGMDDYTKMWLQLVFPIYLIFIATLLIITSRYSTTIQRLTAHRALPVLATLFLLSYTKVLLTVSNVMFSYTSITDLPSNHTTLVWSVDTSVPLFGVKFTILFIVCLILFLTLVPFNIILLFTRTLSYFKVVTYFKPLLDAYQGPYKVKFYYWTGLQLLIRAVFFGLTALDRNVNLTVSILLIGVLIWLQEKMAPFKSKLNNYMEVLCLFNLLVIFVISLYATSNDVVISIFVSLAMIQLLWVILWHIKSLLWSKCPAWFELPARLNNCLNTFRHQRDPEANHIQLVNEVPGVAYNYKEFQEPLIGIEPDK